MKTIAIVTALVLALALFQPAAAIEGSLGQPAGGIAIAIICVAMIISVGSSLIVCMYRNDIIPCLQNRPGVA